MRLENPALTKEAFGVIALKNYDGLPSDPRSVVRKLNRLLGPNPPSPRRDDVTFRCDCERPHHVLSIGPTVVLCCAACRQEWTVSFEERVIRVTRAV